MHLRNAFQLMSLATLACSLLATTQSPSAMAKNTKTTKKTLVAHRGNYFVPPPPAYVPSYNPMYMGAAAAEAQEEPAAPTNPYSKYIYVRDGAQAPHFVQSNKYVTTWNHG